MLLGRAPTALVFSILVAVSGCGDSNASGPGTGSAIGGGAGISSSGGSGQGSGGTGQEAGVGGTSPAEGGTSPGEGGAPPSATVAVSAILNLIPLELCVVVPATATDVPAGTYTIRLEASNLSKGSVDNETKDASEDDYVIVHVPYSANQSNDHRFFMLNGVGAEYTFSLDEPGTVEAYFIDSDTGANHGTATLNLSPGGYQITVDAVTNVIGWRNMCNAEPAYLWSDTETHDLTLESSDLSSAAGREDDYLLVRLPSEIPDDPFRYIMLNGVGAKQQYAALTGDRVRAWFLSAKVGASGQATLRLSRP